MENKKGHGTNRATSEASKEVVVSSLAKLPADGEFGFGTFIMMKTGDPPMRYLAFYGEPTCRGHDFKLKVQSSIVKSIGDLFFDEEAKYVVAKQAGGNQDVFCIVKQNDDYKPFGLLNTPEKQMDPFFMDNGDGVNAVLFRFRRGVHSIWAYRYILPATTPSKEDQHFLTRISDTEQTDCFVGMSEQFFIIIRKVNLLVIDDKTITRDIGLMQRHFRFSDLIKASTKRAVSDISDIRLVTNCEKLAAYIEQNQIKYSHKMVRIKRYHVVGKTAEELTQIISTVPRWQGVFDIRGGQIYLRTSKDVENLIDLFDEEYTVPLMTGDEFDTDVRRLAAPERMGGED